VVPAIVVILVDVGYVEVVLVISLFSMFEVVMMSDIWLLVVVELLLSDVKLPVDTEDVRAPSTL
jgi:hypothetical protein